MNGKQARVSRKAPDRPVVKVVQEDMWAFNVINAHVSTAQQELERALAARNSHMKLLELKYNAEFDATTGALLSKDGKAPEKVDSTKE
jgi:hypothetical protein